MVDARRGLSAEQRLAALRRDRARLRRERMLRELAGPLWGRMVDVIPVIFRAEGMIAHRVDEEEVHDGQHDRIADRVVRGRALTEGHDVAVASGDLLAVQQVEVRVVE